MKGGLSEMGATIKPSEAVERFGLSRATLSRVLNSGIVEGERQPDFSWLISVESLKEYCETKKKGEPQSKPQKDSQALSNLSKALNEINALKRELELKDELLQATKNTQQETAETVKDLRARLDASEEARAAAEESYKRTVNEALSGINRFIIAARPAEETIIQQQPEEPRRGFWLRFFGRGAA